MDIVVVVGMRYGFQNMRRDLSLKTPRLSLKRKEHDELLVAVPTDQRRQ
jgi:hypothetical protein